VGFGVSIKLAPGVPMWTSSHGARASVGPRVKRVHVEVGRRSCWDVQQHARLDDFRNGLIRRVAGAVISRSRLRHLSGVTCATRHGVGGETRS
jgi:hypothetical protein